VQSSNRVFLIGKHFTGQANVFFFDANGERMMTLEVSIETDTSHLEALFKRLMPTSKIKTEIINDTLILTGSVANAGDSNRASQIAARFQVKPLESNADMNLSYPLKVINMLAVEAKEQVMLRVSVSEVNRTLLKQMGINVGAAIASGNLGIGLLTENALPLTAPLGLGKMPIPAWDSTKQALGLYNTGPKADTFGNNGADFFWRSGGQAANGAIRALERDGLLRTLAEPNLTAVSGETARFLAGGEYPIPVSTTNGMLSVEFKKFGVGLAFTPIVAAEDRITLKIESEVSELDVGASVQIASLNIPGIKTRQANTTVELPSGGSLAIAGLLSDDTRQSIDGVPGLKDLPVLGTLFRSRDYVKRETELVVIVTPIIVKHAPRGQLATPTDGLAPASDLKGNLLGHLNRVYGKGDEHAPRGRYEGDVGFIVE
jgi:pilus assembly protein CpaC